MSKKHKGNKQYNTGASNGAASHYVKHTHMGRKMLWALPNKGGVYAGARADLSGRYSAILDCTGLSAYSASKPAIEVSGPDATRYASLIELGDAPATRVSVDWPDGGVPPVAPEFWRALIETVKGNLAVCCVGGHGRTGTALAALYMAQHENDGSNETLAHVVEFIRSAHCREAIETDEQRAYLANLAYMFGYEEGEEFEPSNWYRFKATPAATPSQGALIPATNIAGTYPDVDAKYKWKPEGGTDD